MEMVDDDGVYANVEELQSMKSTMQERNPSNSPDKQHSGIRIYRLTAVCLGLLTVLLLIIITAISIHYNGVLNNTTESYSTQSENLTQLYSALKDERDQTDQLHH
ncbi:hypothetical protein AGOR_G00188700 [Albula goreensis]|uniref:Uncharacterized protein n=1 Tax=Albula goreensis TaxID=1534307 RepID=A0A8T3CU89_9TELE|nr:hypothetical protein AGOR_G00188700 [Albula goreensis]